MKVIFCCPCVSHKIDGYQKDIKILHIPSLKKLDTLSILLLFSSGVDKVFVMACKECAINGKIKYIKGLIREIGLDEERLQLLNEGKISDQNL